MNRQKVIEVIKGELTRTHGGIKVIHTVLKDDIDTFTLIKDNIYLCVPVFGMDRIIELYDEPIPVIMLDIMFRLMNFMQNISK